jgi:hypothetical protein
MGMLRLGIFTPEERFVRRQESENSISIIFFQKTSFFHSLVNS